MYSRTAATSLLVKPDDESDFLFFVIMTNAIIPRVPEPTTKMDTDTTAKYPLFRCDVIVPFVEDILSEFHTLLICIIR